MLGRCSHLCLWNSGCSLEGGPRGGALLMEFCPLDTTSQRPFLSPVQRPLGWAKPWEDHTLSVLGVFPSPASPSLHLEPSQRLLCVVLLSGVRRNPQLSSPGFGDVPLAASSLLRGHWRETPFLLWEPAGLLPLEQCSQSLVLIKPPAFLV